MRWKGFTPEEILALRSNPYTYTVTEKTISFTREFKERMWEGMQNGRPKRDLIIELGYDPDVLGPSRIEGIAYHIKEEANSPEGFHEGKRISKVAARMTEEELTSSAPSHTLRRLQAEVSALWYNELSPPRGAPPWNDLSFI